jgi:hypothetical protein
MKATSAKDLQAETLVGDVRDALLTHIRSMETPWSKLSERQQQAKIDAISRAAESLVRGSVHLIAHQGFPHLVVSTGKWGVKDGIKLEAMASATVDNITKLAEHGAGAAILVLAEAGEFFGERKKAKAAKDQPDLPIHDEDGVIHEDDEGEDDEANGEAESNPLPEPGRPPEPPKDAGRSAAR